MGNFKVKQISGVRRSTTVPQARGRQELGVESFGMQVLDSPQGSINTPSTTTCKTGWRRHSVVLRGRADAVIDR